MTEEDPVNEVDDFFTCCGIKACKWFIKQQNVDIVDKYARNGDTLFLPA
ncbi:hypothetical protein CGLO_10867 [Colletotrichum gloeosporioides Cg-14]|uniref:Uncharacterized protein n=1 Tax=Colletotrichum gloeosporioides (strain Cg-14) TaxID=1237896 RepID=T0LNG5_COLGC|nr:hypothetical protein CGLO_10867 [Colletotrichum gloeosporioides Cg-14]